MENSCCEILIRISSEDGSQKYAHKIVSYESITVSSNDPMLTMYVEEAKNAFKADADSIELTIKYQW